MKNLTVESRNINCLKLILNNLLIYFQLLIAQVISLGILLLCWRVKAQDNVCPPAVNLLPCLCTGSGEGKGDLQCGGTNLNDDTASQILHQFNNPQLLTFLYKVYMDDNQLTIVPNQIPLFPQLNSVRFGSNQITIVESGAFNFSATLFELHLQNNLITTIETGAFQGISTCLCPSSSFYTINFRSMIVMFSYQGSYGKTFIRLENNLLTRLDEDVILDVALQLLPYGPYPFAWIYIESSKNNLIPLYCKQKKLRFH